MKVLIDGDPLVWAVGCVVKDGPLENALHSIKSMIRNILQETESNEYEIWLSGEDNFRKTISPTYKANRKAEHPPHFEEIRNYMIDYHNGLVTDGIEADDAIGLNYTLDDIIVSIDKDLDQLPGKHYNYNKKRIYDISYEEGMLFFYKQMLMGDPADNIKGIPRYGIKTAEKLLYGLSIKDMACTVGYHYAINFNDPEIEWLTNSRLLWILR